MTLETDWLKDRLEGRGDIVVIDGGMGTQLEKVGVPMHGKAWSGEAVLSHPDTVRRVHEDFIRAGAEVVITNTFSTGRHVLEPAGLGDHVVDINTDAVRLAREARENAAQRPVAIFGSICEWGFMEDARWNTPETIGESAREQAELLQSAGVEGIALEMCSEPEFSIAVTEAALTTGLPIWIGVSARRDADTGAVLTFDSSNCSLDELVGRLARYPSMAMHVMHSAVSDVAPALEVVRKHWSGPVGVYPESGDFEMPHWQFVDIIEPQALVEAARGWVREGARLLGGCCGLGPEHTAALCEAFRSD